MKSAPKIMLVASAGGHWVELMRLYPAWRGLQVTYVSTDPSLGEVVRRIAQQDGQPVPAFHAVTEANQWRKARLVKLLMQLTLLLLRTRPDVILTTGAAPGFFALRIGKMLGARTIWIDSMANADELSLSGQRIGRHADLWLTQWEHLAQPDGPHYLGSIL